LGERESMRRADRDFRYHPEACEDFLILPSFLFLSSRPRRGRIRFRFRRQ
jgi:hypothetical protein